MDSATNLKPSPPLLASWLGLMVIIQLHTLQYSIATIATNNPCGDKFVYPRLHFFKMNPDNKLKDGYGHLLNFET